MKYDVIIVGGGTAGCAAAYNLALKNLKVLIIEKNTCLGGLMTSGLVTPMMKISPNAINLDFYNTLLDKLNSYDAQFTYSDGNKGWFNPELLKIVLDELLTNLNVDILFNSEVLDLKILNNSVKSIKINNEMLSEYIETKYIIDATGNSEICKKLNCEFINENNFQPVNLRFIMGGVNVKKLADWLLELDKDRTVTSVTEENGQIHLSTAYTWDTNKNWALRPIFQKAIADNILKNTDSNYFQIFTVPGMPDSIAFNAPRLCYSDDIDINSPIHHSKALIEGRKAILRLANFCKQYIVGFENAYISNIANQLGIRASMRAVGEYVYTYHDIIPGKKFDNSAVISDYPIDVHSNKQDNSILESVKQDYNLPIKALISKDYNNLFMIGRNLSADFKAQGALRIIPNCFSMGEAVAKYISNLEN